MLVISDAHHGLKATIANVFKAMWHRCRVHFMRDALAHVGNGDRQMILARISKVFAQEMAEAATMRDGASLQINYAKNICNAQRSWQRDRAR